VNARAGNRLARQSILSLVDRGIDIVRITLVSPFDE